VDVVKLLDDYEESLDGHIEHLLLHVMSCIDSAGAVSDQGKIIHRILYGDKARLERDINYANLWQKWWVQKGKKGDQMRDDLALSGTSITLVTSIIDDLMRARESLYSYRIHIKQFKVSLLGPMC
jgi:hypothetical protein